MEALVIATVAFAGVPSWLLTSNSSFHAPILEPLSYPPKFQSKDATPVVFMHGMGDAGSNPGMQSLAKTVTDAFPGKYAVAVDVADGMASILEPMDAQLDAFVKAVRADKRLAGGFDAVGLSQGNLVVRAYIERVNDPPVRTFVSICGPMEGIGTCPLNVLYEAICPFWELDKYGANIAFSGYWKDVHDKEGYLTQNAFLPDIGNERAEKEATYRANMASLRAYVLVKASVDSMIVPRETAHHAFWAWGDERTLVPMRESEGYKKDWIGLKTLDESGRITELTFEGDHLRFSSSWWYANIIPLFADDLDEPRAE